MKKIFAFALAMTLVVAFSSCNNKKNAPEQGEEYIDPADVPFENGFKLVTNYITPFGCDLEIIAEDEQTPFLGGYLYAEDANGMTDEEIALEVLKSIQEYIAWVYQSTGQQIPLMEFASTGSHAETIESCDPNTDYVAVAFYIDAESLVPIITDEQGVAKKRFHTKNITEHERLVAPEGRWSNYEDQENYYYSFWGYSADGSAWLDFYATEPLVNGLHITDRNLSNDSRIVFPTGEIDEESGDEIWVTYHIYTADLNVAINSENQISVTGKFIAYNGVEYTLNFTGEESVEEDEEEGGDEEGGGWDDDDELDNGGDNDAPARKHAPAKAAPVHKKLLKI